MPVSSDVTIEVSHRGDVSQRSVDSAVTKVEQVADRCREEVHVIEVRLSLEPSGPRDRPAIAEATIHVEGRPVRAHVAAATIDEAIDLLVDRLRRRIQRHEEQLHRMADRHRTGDSGPGEWRHGDLPTSRPEYLEIPFDEREVRRHKTFAMTPMTLEEALFDLDQLGHDFYLFVDEATDVDCVVWHGGESVELAAADPSQYEGTESNHDIRITPTAPPTLALEQAKEHLEAMGGQHLFFRSDDDGQGRVLYRRYDGHYGLVTPA